MNKYIQCICLLAMIGCKNAAPTIAHDISIGHCDVSAAKAVALLGPEEELVPLNGSALLPLPGFCASEVGLMLGRFKEVAKSKRNGELHFVQCVNGNLETIQRIDFFCEDWQKIELIYQRDKTKLFLAYSRETDAAWPILCQNGKFSVGKFAGSE